MYASYKVVLIHTTSNFGSPVIELGIRNAINSNENRHEHDYSMHQNHFGSCSALVQNQEQHRSFDVIKSIAAFAKLAALKYFVFIDIVVLVQTVLWTLKLN